MAKKKKPETSKPTVPVIPEDHQEAHLVSLNGMYENYFLDYASYVILERAVPAIEDGLKPVQRRILHAMRDMDDGRYHKVANIIGQTMMYHPHGDAAIGNALVNMGQKDLMIDTQGNWGDFRTGDSAAAARYIEARLTKFALEVAFNAQTTEWQLSYDGRRKEPITLPMKFPLLLAQGAEGIAVGLSTHILPHNFIEIIKASIKVLEGKKFTLYPDFQTGGIMDVSDYQDGKRGGRVKVRAKIELLDKKTLVIRELPYGVTTVGMIESILKANEKGKIKIKRVVDNTASDVEIQIELQPGISPDVTMDALYSFTDCEVSVSPNACVIVDEKPVFITVSDILRISTENTRELLRRELEIKKGELEEKWLFASLEKIFIEKRIYRDIEECETWEAVIEVIRKGLKKYVATPSDPQRSANDKRHVLFRDITEEDIVRLTEIRIKRISKYNSFQADEMIKGLEKDLKQVKYDLKHLTEFAISYFEKLLEKYGKGKERRTRIATLETIVATEVIANNTKLYVNRKEGFIGFGLKKDEFVTECSDIDDVIVFRQDGKCMVTKISEKTFVGKDILHVAIFRKNDDRTTYNMVYSDGKQGKSMVKRFQIMGVTRDKEYDLTSGNPGSRVLYLTANPNGESEVISVQLTQGSTARKKQFDFDFAEVEIKGRATQGNILTKYPVRKIQRKEVGKSTLSARQLWWDDTTGRIQTDERGYYLGEFDTGDQLIAIFRNGDYEVNHFDQVIKYDPEETLVVAKYFPDLVVSAVYYDGSKGWTMVKRFLIDTTSLGQRFSFITAHKDSRLYYASVKAHPIVSYSFRTKSKTFSSEVDLETFIDVKGWKAQGNRLCEFKLTKIEEQEKLSRKKDRYKPGETIEFEF